VYLAYRCYTLISPIFCKLDIKFLYSIVLEGFLSHIFKINLYSYSFKDPPAFFINSRGILSEIGALSDFSLLIIAHISLNMVISPHCCHLKTDAIKFTVYKNLFYVQISSPRLNPFGLIGPYAE